MMLSKSKRINDALEVMGIKNEEDVLYHLPRTYADFSLTTLDNLQNKQRLVMRGKLVSNPTFTRGRKVTMVSFSCVSNDSHFFRVTAFNRPYLLKTLNFNDVYTIIGSYDEAKKTVNLVNIVKGEMNEQLKPIYSLPLGLENHLYINLVERVFKNIENSIKNVIPDNLKNKYRLLDKKEALRSVHQPKKWEDVHNGLRTLKYEECLLFALQNLLIREENQLIIDNKENRIPLFKVNDFIRSLPYKLTKDQINAIREIVLDMNSKKIMYRLLQGDVGTGKTIVALIAIYSATLRNDQAALMAPTDALAKQHYQTICNLFKGKLKVALLVGSLKESERNETLKKIKNHEVDIIVGTHALFSKDVEYNSLGLAVIDEQHKFGVNQRLLLSQKGERTDLLLMSATPIPRTLAMTLYGDMDISTLKEFPFKERFVETKIVSYDSPSIKEHIEDALKNGSHVFIVAPLISFQEERTSVEKLFAEYKKIYGDRVGLLHGQLDDLTKDQVLNDFYKNERPILISTSVIEVGIDVKDATLMIIYDASSYGLSSLHQLRGRIGRDGKKAYCLLVDEDQEKLEILTKSNDGFVIAEEDLKMRGPGDMNGLRQSGLPSFTYVNIINDIRIFETARNDAREILNQDKNRCSSIVKMAYKLTKGNKFTNV